MAAIEIFSPSNKDRPENRASFVANAATLLKNDICVSMVDMDNWYHPLAIGQPLPTLAVWLTETAAISLDLESSYQETCRALRIR